MTRKELNKFIEAQKVLAREQVSENCKKMRENRKNEIAQSMNLTETLALAARHMTIAVDVLEVCLNKKPKLKSHSDYGSSIYKLRGALNGASLDEFINKTMELEGDPEFKKIINLEKESIKEINVNYDVVRANCTLHTNIKDAVAYIESLGFVLPADEIPSMQLMRPLDPRFLIAKGEPVQEA